MFTKRVFSFVVAPLFISGCVTTGGEKWTCTGERMINSYYTGSDKAMIHLEGYSRGGNYDVTKNAEGTQATGTTRDGTAFTCTKAQ